MAELSLIQYYRLGNAPPGPEAAGAVLAQGAASRGGTSRPREVKSGLKLSKERVTDTHQSRRASGASNHTVQGAKGVGGGELSFIQ